MALTGDFAQLDKLTSNLNKLAEVPARASKEVAIELTKELQSEFENGVDPYGKPWAPLKPSTLAKGRHPPPLTAGGDLKRGTKATPSQHVGVQIELGASYGAFHQFGAEKMVARKILPSFSMPKKWSEIIIEATRKAYRKQLGK